MLFIDGHCTVKRSVEVGAWLTLVGTAANDTIKRLYQERSRNLLSQP